MSGVDVVGVDACAGGWASVSLRDGRFHGARVGGSLDELLRSAPEAVVVGIDMPLGLLESAAWRRADQLAAGRLGPRRARVFRVAPRPVWEQTSYPAANELCRRLTGGGLSRQSWALREKLCQANARRDGGDTRLHEVHPELCFAAMNGGQPVAWSKKSWNGQMARRRLLAEHGIAVPDGLVGAAGGVAPDDVLDAAAAAWTAHRVARCIAEPLPDPPERTATGQPVAIWC